MNFPTGRNIQVHLTLFLLFESINIFIDNRGYTITHDYNTIFQVISTLWKFHQRLKNSALEVDRRQVLNTNSITTVGLNVRSF